MDPRTIEVKETPKSVFIGRDNWRKFMLGSAGALMFVNLFFIACIVVYCIDVQQFYYLFYGYAGAWNPFAILAYISFALALLIPSILTNVGRSAFVPFFLIILCCYAYIPAFLIRVTWKNEISFSQELVMGYICWVAAVIGLFVNVIATKRRINPVVGVAVGAVLCTIGVGVYVFVLKKLDPYRLTILVLIGANVGLSYYLNIDAMFMLNKRNDFYLNSDWFLGFVHLHTDIFFRFWIDIFRRDVEYIDTDNLNGKSIVLNSAIQRSRLAPISEVNEDNSDVEDMDRTNTSGIGGKSMPKM